MHSTVVKENRIAILISFMLWKETSVLHFDFWLKWQWSCVLIGRWCGLVVGGGWGWTPTSCPVRPSLLECGNPFVSISGDCALTRLRISEVAAGFWGSVRSCRTPRWNRRRRLTWSWIPQAPKVCTCAPCLCGTFDYLLQVVLLGVFFILSI